MEIIDLIHISTNSYISTIYIILLDDGVIIQINIINL